MDSLPPVALSPREDRPAAPARAGRWRAHLFRLVIVILPLVFGIERANASLWLTQEATLENRVGRSDLIAIGKVESIATSWEGGHVVRQVAFSVTEALKGAPATEIVIKARGGTFRGIGERVSGAPEFTPGQRSLVFLRNLHDDPDRPRYGILDRAVGKMDIEPSAAGGDMVTWIRPELQRIDHVRLTDIAERVKAAMRARP